RGRDPGSRALRALERPRARPDLRIAAQELPVLLLGGRGLDRQARRSLRHRDPGPAPHRAPRDHRAVRLADDPAPLSAVPGSTRAVVVWAEQAIFTSLPRRGKAGYHLVARSPGVSDAEANALTTWSPSHGGLVVDASNHSSANFHPLP